VAWWYTVTLFGYCIRDLHTATPDMSTVTMFLWYISQVFNYTTGQIMCSDGGLVRYCLYLNGVVEQRNFVYVIAIEKIYHDLINVTVFRNLVCHLCRVYVWQLWCASAKLIIYNFLSFLLKIQHTQFVWSFHNPLRASYQRLHGFCARVIQSRELSHFLPIVRV
jgi:hypothetical protein